MSIIKHRPAQLPRQRDPFYFARSLFDWDAFENGRTTQTFSPAFEIKEHEDGFHLRADLPGVKDKDLDVSLHGNVLSVSGSRAAEERKEGETYYIYERQYGSFSRSFTLPDSANGEGIKADLKDGVLEVVIPKRAAEKPQKIEIKRH